VESIAEAHVRLIRIVVVIRSQRKRCLNVLAHAAGDFAAARVLFERAANAGSAEGAQSLGSTYDPLVIKRLGALMVKPDIETARKWYQLAADRGSAAAKLQLANLPPGR